MLDADGIIRHIVIGSAYGPVLSIDATLNQSYWDVMAPADARKLATLFARLNPSLPPVAVDFTLISANTSQYRYATVQAAASGAIHVTLTRHNPAAIARAK